MSFRTCMVLLLLRACLVSGLLLGPLSASDFSAWTRWPLRQSLDLPAGEGLRKLDLPPSTLGMLQPSFQDLRLVDGEGRELPWAVELPVLPKRVLREVHGFHVVLDETCTVLVFPLPPSGASPEAVVIESSARSFNKALRIEVSPDRLQWTLLQDKLPFTRESGGIPPVPLPKGLSGWLRLTLDDRRSPPVPLERVSLRLLEEDSMALSPLACDLGRLERLDLETRQELRFPASGVHLSGLVLDIADPVFRRRARLVHKIFSGERLEERVLAESWLERLPTAPSQPLLPVRFTTECRLPTSSLVLVIENGDSPPLQLRSIAADSRPIRLVLVAPQAGTCHLLGGARQVSMPVYDLASMASEFRGLPCSQASFGSVQANPYYRESELDADFPTMGPALDVRAWAASKPVYLAHAGVQRLELDPESLARASDSLGDLRLIRGRQQVPYVLETCSFLRSLPLPLLRTEESVPERLSRWRIQLPHQGLPVKSLTLVTSSVVFSRQFSLFEFRRDARGQPFPVQLGDLQWTKKEGREAQASIDLRTRPQTDLLFLETFDGDNLPVSLERVSAYLPVHRLYFRSTDAQSLTLYYGNPGVSSPAYDLRLVGPQLLAVDPSQATLGPEEVSPLSLRQSAAVQPSSRVSWLFWSAIVLVIGALLFALSKLLPKSDAGQ